MKVRLWLPGVAALAIFGVAGTPPLRIAEAQQAYSDQVYSNQTRSFQSPWQKIDDAAKLENPADGIRSALSLTKF